MSNKLIILIVVLVYIVGCSSSNELTKPYVIPYADSKESPLFIYNLPATMLEFKVTVRQTQKIRGPYADYGVRFLGLTNTAIIQRNSETYEIENVKLTTHQVQDSANWYSYIHNPELIPSFTLNPKNALLGLNKDVEDGIIESHIESVVPIPVDLNAQFYDLGMQKILIEEIQTVYREIKKDSAVIKVPVKEYVKSKRNEEELARLASDFITRVKTLRFELVAGLYEVFPEGRSLEATIKELYSVEKRYLELFVGVEKDTTYTYTFTYIPETGIDTPKTKTLCYFDKETGISLISPKQMYTNNNRNQHFIVSLDYESYDPLVNQKISPGGPVYRIPALCNVELSIGDNPVYESKQYINQLGSVYQLPIDVLRSNKYQLEFDPQSGNIKRVKSPLEPILKKK